MAKSRMKNSRFAGELLVAAELTRLGLSVALHNTFGTNTQDFDLSVGNADDDSVQVQVKALKGPNAFLIDPENIKPKVVYVFVIVGEAGTLGWASARSRSPNRAGTGSAPHRVRSHPPGGSDLPQARRSDRGSRDRARTETSAPAVG